MDEVYKGREDEPIATKTRLGWIISDRSGVVAKNRSFTIMQVSEEMKMDSLVESFWKQEEFADSGKMLTPDEIENEELFRKTHFRNENGRYVVRLPFKVNKKN